MRNAGGALPSRHVLGNYELFEEIGRGGMGIVYRALDLSLDRVVAIKVLRDDLRAHPSIVTRFSREAQAAARLDHPNIVQIFSVGAVDRTPFIAMEFVDALPLSAVMQREHRLEWAPALEITRQIAAALACAHDSHVIHRDVKPPNILLDDRRHAFVTDFGIAKILTLDDNLTVDGTRLGTPHYMAPERCKTGEVTAASDLYSLGVLTFQMLTGRLPYEASTPVEMVQRIASQPPARVRAYVPGVPEDVERLVAWLMEREPKHRPASGHAVCDAIDRVLAGHPLDVNEARTTVAIESFRKDLAADTGANKTTAAGNAKSPRLRRYAIAAATCVAALAIGVLAWRAVAPAAPAAPALGPQAWFANSGLAVFSGEGDQVTLVELQLPGYEVHSMLPAGADGSVAVTLDQTGPGGRRVLCIVSPSAKRADLRFASTAPGAQFELLASVAGFPGALRDGYGWVRTGDELSLVSLRDPSASTALSIVDETRAVVGLHPSGVQWASPLLDPNGNASLVAYTIENGQAVPRAIAPGGPRIAQVQYAPDGQSIAYLRETGLETFALHVASAAGVDIKPAALREGRIAIGPGALNTDASMVLVTVESDSGAMSVDVVSVRDGSLVAAFAGASCAAWHGPSGDVILCAPDHKGAQQLWRANPATPNRREQLTFLDGGAGQTVLVSPDGAWATTVAAGTPTPSAIFVRLIK